MYHIDNVSYVSTAAADATEDYSEVVDAFKVLFGDEWESRWSDGSGWLDKIKCYSDWCSQFKYELVPFVLESPGAFHKDAVAFVKSLARSAPGDPDKFVSKWLAEISVSLVEIWCRFLRKCIQDLQNPNWKSRCAEEASV